MPAHPEQCAIARSIPGAHVTGVLRDLERGTLKFLPADVFAFVASFDAGGFRGRELDPADLVQGGIEDDKGCLVPA